MKRGVSNLEKTEFLHLGRMGKGWTCVTCVTSAVLAAQGWAAEALLDAGAAAWAASAQHI